MCNTNWYFWGIFLQKKKHSHRFSFFGLVSYISWPGWWERCRWVFAEVAGCFKCCFLLLLFHFSLTNRWRTQFNGCKLQAIYIFSLESRKSVWLFVGVISICVTHWRSSTFSVFDLFFGGMGFRLGALEVDRRLILFLVILKARYPERTLHEQASSWQHWSSDQTKTWLFRLI